MPITRCLVVAFTGCLGLSTLAHAQSPLRLQDVTPCRLVDTRQQNGGHGFQGSQTLDLRQAAMSGGAYGTCPHFDLSSAQAYSLNVTLVPINNGPVSYLTIWPTGQTRPLVSLMNSLDGRIKADAAIVPAGSAGKVDVYVTNTTNVVIDINAYFDSASDASSLAFFPLPPCRVVDTRTGQGGGTLQAGIEEDFSIPGNCGIPANAQAYSFNITAVPVQGILGYLTVWPAGQSQPVVSTLNDLTGTIVANAAIVPAGAQSKTAAYASNATNVIIDVDGYFAPASSAPNPLSLYTLVPCRVLDTRTTIGMFNGQIPVGVVGSLCGVPNVAQAFTFNATVVPSGSLGYLTLWPEGQQRPTTVSTLNAVDGAITSNMAIVPAGTGNESIDAYAAGTTQLILDVASYFAPVSVLAVQNNSPLPNGVVNVSYSVQLVATGGIAPYSWSLNGGFLPSGLTLNSNGLISGTPTATGDFMFGAKVTDSNSPPSTSTAGFGLSVDATVQTLVVSTQSLPPGTLNTPYNTMLAANGGVTPYSWTILSGTLPTGLALNAATGLVSGVPAAAGLANITVKVTDAQAHTATQALSLSINTGDANGTLNGMYAISFAGYDHGNWFTAAGSITADGNGHITGGETDVSNISSGVEHANITGGTYSIASNGLGQISWNDSLGGSVQLLVATGAAEDMRVIGYNQNGSNGSWGAGVLRQQNPSIFNLSSLAGKWTFGTQGFDASGGPLGVAGTYTQSSTGSITNGAEDVNDFGNLVQTTFTGSDGAVDANGRSAVQVQLTGVGTLHYAAYVVSANEILFVQTDTGSGRSYAISNALRQTGAPFNNGILNGKGVGQTSKGSHFGGGNPVSHVEAFLLAADGLGHLTVTININDGGVIAHQVSDSGTYSVASNGRTVVNLQLSGESICYVVARNQAFCINTGGGAGVTYIQSQSAGPFNAATLAGEYLGGSLPQYVVGTDSSASSLFLDGVLSGSFITDQSGPGGTMLNEVGSVTYSVDSTGGITLSQNGGDIAYGYIVAPHKFVIISLDNNPRTIIEVTSSAPHHR